MNSYESHFRQDLLKIALHFTYFLMLKHKNWPISSPLLILFHLFSSLHIWMNGCEWVFCVFSFDTVCVVLLTTGMQEIQICTDTIKMEVWVFECPVIGNQLHSSLYIKPMKIIQICVHSIIFQLSAK